MGACYNDCARSPFALKIDSRCPCPPPFPRSSNRQVVVFVPELRPGVAEVFEATGAQVLRLAARHQARLAPGARGAGGVDGIELSPWRLLGVRVIQPLNPPPGP